MPAMLWNFWSISLGEIIMAAIVVILMLSFVIGYYLGHAATIGGLEHRDPTETEIKAAKEKYRNDYFNRSDED